MDNNITVRKSHLINQGNILADRIIVSNYEKGKELEKGIDQLVEISSKEINSRVIILDKEALVISDSYNESKGETLQTYEIDEALKGKIVDNQYNYNNRYNSLNVAIPILSKGNEVKGVVFITSSLLEIVSQTNDVLRRYLVFSLMIILITALISLLFAHYIASPIERLTYSINKISNGNMEQKVEIVGNDELSNLGKAFNLMAVKLSQVDKQRKEFVASVSHELRTPLSAMKVLSESLLHQNNATEDTYRDFLQDIDTEVDRLNNIIEDLLSLVDMDKEKLQLKYQDTNLNSLIKQLLYSLKPLAIKKKIEIKFNETEDIIISLDQLKIQQALMNVISNAIKYTHEGGKVCIRIYLEQNYSVIKIGDNGIGIPEESIPYIFDKFYRVDKARSRNTGGTGLGLSITKQIIELHQGIIDVESRVNFGTTFYIKIPQNII